MSRRVVITGMGIISPLGIGIKENWEALAAGKSGIGPITKFDATNFPSRIAGEVRNFNPEDYIDRKEIKKMDAFIHFAIAATQMALNDARLTIDQSNAVRVGVIIGSGIGGLPLLENQYQAYLKGGHRRISPFFIPGMIVNLASGQVAIKFGAKGPNSAVCTACATGTHAIGDAYRLIRVAEADIMIAGGTESVITPLAVGGFSSMKALSTRNEEPEKASRPFDAGRDGFVMSEGVGVVILEEIGSAVKRNAAIHAEIVGYGMSSDAYHISAPSTDGPMRVMQNAIRSANVDPSVVDFINAHGTSTPQGDKAETDAIKKVFGERAYKIAISSTKSMMGHLLGAAGGVETIATVLSIKHDTATPTINLTAPDPQCDLNYVPNQSRKMTINYALNNSFGFGGTNASLLLKKYSE
ncbi:MAG: beta-ketoacyl-ACP synthase II [Acidobacteriota bacterium]